MEPLSLTPSTDDGSFEYLQLHLSQTEWSPTHSATAFLVVALRYIRGSRKTPPEEEKDTRLLLIHLPLEKEMMRRDGRAAESGNALFRRLHANIHFLQRCQKKTKKKTGRINMHEGLKEADEGRVRTPGLSRCMLIKHSSARWLSPVWQQPSGGIYTRLVLVMAAVCPSCNWT